MHKIYDQTYICPKEPQIHFGKVYGQIGPYLLDDLRLLSIIVFLGEK